MTAKVEPITEPVKEVFPELPSQILLEAHLSLQVTTDNAK